jgi:Rieske Fe-S protein
MDTRIGEIASRRTFLGQSLLLGFLSLGRRLRAQVSQTVRYRPLARPVRLPLTELPTRGRARSFVADAVTLPTAATPNQPIRVSGMIARAADDRFSAVCVRCPHELCDVDFVADPNSLPQEIVDEIGHPVKEPVYVCPCHNSTFSVEDGGRLAGPAPRGLYRFRVTNVDASTIEIAEVEEDVLIFI